MTIMKGKRVTNIKSALVLGLSLLAAIGPARAGSVDHYNPGVMNIRDFLMPAPGFYGVLYNYFYTSDRLNDNNGNQVKSININPGPGPGATLNLKPKLDLYALAPTLIWISPWNLGGVRYGAVISSTFANSPRQQNLWVDSGSGSLPKV
jgi:hypothetical protein